MTCPRSLVRGYRGSRAVGYRASELARRLIIEGAVWPDMVVVLAPALYLLLGVSQPLSQILIILAPGLERTLERFTSKVLHARRSETL